MQARLDKGRKPGESPSEHRRRVGFNNPGAVALDKPTANAAPGILSITISGQIKGGKNNMVVTRAGLHFPKKDWAAWRNRAVAEIKAQLPAGWQPLSNPCSLSLEYVAGDLRRRDQPAIIDSIFHCLEKAGVVTDDTLLWVSKSSRRHDKQNPMAKLEFYHP